MTTTAPQLPTELAAPLRELADALVAAAGDDLVAVMLHGPAALGGSPAAGGEIELLVCLRHTRPELLARIAPPLRQARRRVRIAPMIAGVDEIARAADVFPVRFRALQRSHVLLAGRDPFAGVAVARTHLRVRVEQELRNLCLRLRRRYVVSLDDPLSCAFQLRHGVGPLTFALRGLLDCVDPDVDVDDAPRAVFAAASARLGLDATTTTALGALVEGTAPADAAALFRDVLRLVERAAAIADELPSGA